MDQPLITFLSPCYNHSKYVIESLESIKNQTYSNIQHIIIDDCSKDDSAYKIQKWIEENNYKCEFIQHKQNKGISYTQNESLELCKGAFWTPLATDDYIKPQRTELLYAYLKKNPEAGMVVSDCRLVNEYSKEIAPEGITSFLNYCIRNRQDWTSDEFGSYASLLKGNYIPGSMMVRKSVFDELGKFDTTLKIEDWDMWLRISQKYKIGLCDGILTFYRFHDSNAMKQADVVSKNILKIFFRQKDYCFNNGLKKNYIEQYQEYYNHNFHPTRKMRQSMFFIKHGSLKLLAEMTIKKVAGKLIST